MNAVSREPDSEAHLQVAPRQNDVRHARCVVGGRDHRPRVGNEDCFAFTIFRQWDQRIPKATDCEESVVIVLFFGEHRANEVTPSEVHDSVGKQRDAADTCAPASRDAGKPDVIIGARDFIMANQSGFYAIWAVRVTSGWTRCVWVDKGDRGVQPRPPVPKAFPSWILWQDVHSSNGVDGALTDAAFDRVVATYRRT
ncbi:MAG: hypothetical protein AAF371_08330 [Pseudomonadota bacterium]